MTVRDEDEECDADLLRLGHPLEGDCYDGIVVPSFDHSWPVDGNDLTCRLKTFWTRNCWLFS